MSHLYEATFRWPHPGASDVIVTGSFDSWSCSHHLAKTPTGLFEGIVKIPWGEKVSYKYIVNGRWSTTDDQPTELDPMGNLNNVFRAPTQPEPVRISASEPAPEPATETETKSTVGAINGFLEVAKQAAVSMVEAIAPGTTETPAPTPAVETPAVEYTFTPEPTPAAPASPPAEHVSPPAEPEPAFDALELTLAEPEPTFAEPEPTFAEPEPTFAEPEPTFAEPEPASAEPEVATEVTNTAILPSEVTNTAILPSEVTNTAILPSESVAVAPEVPVPILPLSTEPPTDVVIAPLADVSETNPLETIIVEGSTVADTAETPVPPSAPAPVEIAPEEKPSTHTPVVLNGTSEGKPATNGVAPAEDSAVINGTNGTHPEEAKPKTATNGADKAATINGKSTTPTKEKKMRFPSLSLRHSRTRSSLESGTSEFGEVKEANGKETTSPFATVQHSKRRTSIFGKLRNAFSHHPKKEASESST